MTAPAGGRGSPLEGRRLGDFVVRQKLGEGGFGEVYRAEQPQLGREAVIKVLRGERQRSPEGAQRFLREVQLAARLDHPFAAHIYAFGAEPDGLRWIAMELVRGTPLDQLLGTQGPLSVERFTPLLERICEVLHAAHEQGIVHRDIKPANVMVLSRAGRLSPKLLDFGIAKLADGASSGSLPVVPALDGATMLGHGHTPEGEATARTVSAAESGPHESPGALTSDGAMMGSPPYMAPEQWVSARGVDARTDLYALGCLCFEALTGAPPFVAHTLRGVAQAHASAPVPLLPAEVPAALNEVLRRALAKRPGERFASALELAAAFRAASGVAVEREALPRLPDAVREVQLAGAPEPLAEAVAALDAATNAHQARDQVAQVVHTAARLIGLYAIACRSRIGSGGAESEPVREAVRALGRRGLNDGEWVELARGFVQPFAHRRDAYPLPELVALFFGPSDEPLPGPFTELLEGAAALATAATPVQLHAQLAQAVPRLGRLLEALAFLADYPIAVVRGEAAERWMGARRSHRATLHPIGPSVVAGQPVLFDAEGHPVVELAPLVQIARPTPGAQNELFLLEGPGRRGAKLVALPAGFERHDESVWEWFAERVLDVGAAAAPAAEEERSPYRGLSAFAREDAAWFIGREREAEALVNRLRVQPLIAVVGPSGAGKSSFVQAGVLPLLPPSWRVVTVRPGGSPFAALEARLERAGFAPGGLAARCAAHRGALGELLRAGAPPGGGVLLVVDQLEELLTLCVDLDERARFAEAVAQAARDADDPIRVVCTLRDDFLIRCQRLAGMQERVGPGLQLLSAPEPDDLLRILIEPARRARYELDDPELPAEMVREVAGQPAALPLLSFAAAKLWELRDRHFRRLTRKAYQAMGGVVGALAQHAEATLGQLGPDQQRLTREAFRHLVTSEGTRAVVSRRELVQLLGGPGEAVIETLIAARLLTSSDAEGGEVRIEVAHEALLEAWPRLVGWRRDDAEGARLRDQLRAAARQWSERGRPRGLLWRGEALLELQIWRARHAPRLTDDEREFAAASTDDAARGRRRLRSALIGVFAVLAAGVVGLTTVYRRAEHAAERAAASARQAEARLAELFEEQGRQLFSDGDPMRALPYLAEAYRRGRDGPALQYMLGRTEQAFDPLERTLSGHHGAIDWAGFSPDGARVVTAGDDGAVRLWRSDSGALERTLSVGKGALWRVEFDRAGRRLVTAGLDGRASIWDAATGERVATLRANDARLWTAHFDRDGRRVLTSGADGAARIWRVADGKLLATMVGRPANWQAAFSPDGANVVTAGDHSPVTLWSAADGHLIRTLGEHAANVFEVAYSPDASFVATASSDRTARLWRVNGARPEELLHPLAVKALAIAGDGRRVATGCDDGVLRIWDASTGRLLQTLAGHRGPITQVAFDSSGARVAAAGSDGTARVWEVATGRPQAVLIGHLATVAGVWFDPAGRRLVTASSDRTAKLWDPARGGRPVVASAGHAEVWSVRLTPDGDRLLTAGSDQTARTFSLPGGAELARFSVGGAAQCASWSGDGSRLATGAPGEVTVWSAGGHKLAAFGGLPGDTTAVAFDASTSRVAATSGRVARVWRLADGALLGELGPHDETVEAVAFSLDGARVATAGDDRTARIWRLPSRLEASGHAESPLAAIAFSPDGARVAAAGDDRSITLWDAATGRVVSVWEGETDAATAVAFGPGGAIAATGAFDGEVMLWSAGDGKLLDRWRAHGGEMVSAVAFSADGEALATGGRDGFARVWPLPRNRLSADEVARVARCRSPFRIDGQRLTRGAIDAAACR